MCRYRRRGTEAADRTYEGWHEEKDVVMAVGSVWQESWERGFDLLLMEAERRMYQEKAAYYNNAGIDRRH